MFYGSEDAKTAVAEIDDDPQLGMWIGTFRTTRPATILDLTRLPRPFRFFEIQSDSDTRNRYAIDFLHSFVKSLAEKVEEANREHVEYVPTQVVTEYFRTAFRHDDAPIDGICYPSAQRAKANSLVLFADQDSVVLSPSEIQTLTSSGDRESWQFQSAQKKAWLKLVKKRQIRSPASC